MKNNKLKIEISKIVFIAFIAVLLCSVLLSAIILPFLHTVGVADAVDGDDVFVGENLLLNSNFFTNTIGDSIYTTSSAPIPIVDNWFLGMSSAGNSAVYNSSLMSLSTAVKETSGNYAYVLQILDFIPEVEGKTIHFHVQLSSNVGNWLIQLWARNNKGVTVQLASTDYQASSSYLDLTYNVPLNLSAEYSYFRFLIQTRDALSIKNAKCELGDVFTGWVPNRNDTVVDNPNVYIPFDNGSVGLEISNFYISSVPSWGFIPSDNSVQRPIFIFGTNRGNYSMWYTSVKYLVYNNTSRFTWNSPIVTPGLYTNSAIYDIKDDVYLYVFTNWSLKDYQDNGYIYADSTSLIYNNCASNGDKGLYTSFYAIHGVGNFEQVSCDNYYVNSVFNMPLDYSSDTSIMELFRSKTKIVSLSNNDLDIAFNVFAADYSTGFSLGFTGGYNSGYTQGYSEGSTEGFDKGNALGVETGYENGYSEGQHYGYNIGYERGKYDSEASDYTFLGLFGAIIDAPLNAFKSMFDFEIFGVNMTGFFLSLFSIAVILVVVKLLIGR